MKASSQFVAYSAVGAGLAVILLYFASLLPTGRLAVVCASSVSAVFIRMRCGRKWALLCFCASALLALLLLPEKGVAILYTAFLGYYPLIKLECVRISNRMYRWFVRLGVFNFAFLVVLWLTQQFAVSWLAVGESSRWLLWIAGNALFLVYDYALTQVILIYLRKIDGRI